MSRIIASTLGSALAISALLAGDLGSAGIGAEAATASTPASAGQPQPAIALDAAALEPLRTAFAESDAIAAALVADSLAGVAAHAAAAERALTAAAQHAASIAAALTDGARAAAALASDTQLEAAREHFGLVQRALLTAAGADPRLRSGRAVFRCPMTKHFPKWSQASDRLANPYLGQAMPECGERSTWTDRPATSPAQAAGPAMAASDADAVAYWTCSMHPSVKLAGPGKCPICSMDLIAVTKGEVASGEIIVDEVRRQLIGVRTGAVERGKLTLTVHAYGMVAPDETALADISLKTSGWITALEADAVGAPVAKGQPLFELYSPDLYAAQQEYAAIVAGGGDAGVRAAARERLRLDDLPAEQIERLAQGGAAQQRTTVVSPIDGYVLKKDVVQGSAVPAGTTVMRLASADRAWLVADVVEHDLPLVAVGQAATVTVPSQPALALHGRVAFVYPELRDESRAGRVRIELANGDHGLRPNQYAGVDIAVDRGDRLLVPKEAILYAGERRLVFVDLGGGRLRPQAITVGETSDTQAEVVAGLKAGDVVVTSGHFLLSAESRIRSAEAFWGAPHDER